MPTALSVSQQADTVLGARDLPGVARVSLALSIPKTAKAFGLDVLPTLLARADEVIE